MSYRIVSRLIAAAALVVFSVRASAQVSNDLTFEHVNVIPMDRNRVLRDQTVIVRDGVVVAIGRSVPSLRKATVIDGSGRWLMPGLADMHVHSTTSRDMKVFLANGVTTVLNMGGATTGFVDQVVPGINSGDRPGPHIYLSLRVDGTPEYGQLVVATPAQARATVSTAKTNKYDFIKVYNNLAPETFAALVDEGRREGIPIVGHGVTRVGIQRQLALGQLMVAHLEEFFYTSFFPAGADVGTTAPSLDQIPRAVDFTRRSGAFVTADLATYARIAEQWGRPDTVRTYLANPVVRYLDPGDRISWRHADYGKRTGSLAERLAFLRSFAKALADAGVPLIVGTDAPTMAGLAPGFSVYDDLVELAHAGLTPFEVLSAATRNPGLMIARAKPDDRCFGVVAVGCRADLLLLDGNPLVDLATLTRPSGVSVKGRWYDQRELASLLSEVANEYELATQPPRHEAAEP